MTLSKKQLCLLAIPLLAIGVIGVSALATNHTSALLGTSTGQTQGDTVEPNDKADTNEVNNANDKIDANDMTSSSEVVNKQSNAQANQALGEAADDATRQ